MPELLITAYWPGNDDLSPVPLTPNRSPSLSSVGGCGGEKSERLSMSPDRASVSPAGDCRSSGSVQLNASLRGAASLATTADDSPLLAGVHCRLETKDLWDKFYELGTEMIITKSGRSAGSLSITAGRRAGAISNLGCRKIIGKSSSCRNTFVQKCKI